jgi:hypothetical protein
MERQGWHRLLAEAPQSYKPGEFPIAAYSEFMPPPRIAWRPYGGHEPMPFTADDPFGWQVSEYEEAVELRPGLTHLARHVLGAMVRVAQGKPAEGLARAKLEGNPYWPPELAQRAGDLPHERYVVLLPLALSRSQDDKGRVRWTLFGSSEQGPERGFWRGFSLSPRREMPADFGIGCIGRLLHHAYGESPEGLADLRRAGFRILPTEEGDHPFAFWREDPLPAWTAPYLWKKGESVGRVRYLLTFRPFGSLPAAIRRAYLAGDLCLLPFPGSLVFWGAPPLVRMEPELPMAMQIPLLPVCERHEAGRGVRVPQSGWMHEHHPDQPVPDPRHGVLRNTYRRTHRWQRLHRHEDELAVFGTEDRMAHVLFSAAPDDVGLYGKPMARNAQIWTHDYQLLLDGPRAGREDLERAAAAVKTGGHFGYRFVFPAMRVGPYEVYWHRPLVAWLSPGSGEPEVLPDANVGYLTAYDADRPRLDRPIELWPRLLDREPYRIAVRGFTEAHEHRDHRVAINVRKLLDAWRLLGQRPLPRSFARQLLTLPKESSLEDWIESLGDFAGDAEAGRTLVREVTRLLDPPAPAMRAKEMGTGTSLDAVLPRFPHIGSEPVPIPSQALTFHRTARRSFEVAYWKTIARLAEGRYVNKDNADCVDDPASRAARRHHHRDLEALGDYLLAHYRRTITRCGMAGKALVGDLPFRWRTDFEFPWSDGWRNNQEDKTEERNLLVVIPGRDRRRAVIMADHYDTAFMEDRYDKAKGGSGARLAAAGADDNHSATAALMFGAPVFLELSRAGRLACDVWLVHLTGEEFPSDCMGARRLAQRLVERSLKVRVAGRRPVDLSKVRVQGVYVLDMVAHNRDHDLDVFQISPGTSGESMELAYRAHLANMIWNARVPAWNGRPPRRGKGRGRRSADGAAIPEIAAHPHLHGEIRPPANPRSSLYNTDGQIFSDAGIPVVLFMENYDINRVGYHDTHDTMANIDLDYGAGVAAIAIESVARAATADVEDNSPARGTP